MGFLVSGQCIGDAAVARNLYYSQSSGPWVTAGDPPLYSVLEYSGAWSLVTRQSGVVLYSMPLPDPAFPACNPVDSLADGASLGFGVLLVWAAAFWAHAARRAL